MFVLDESIFRYDLGGILRLLSRVDSFVAHTPGHCLRFAAFGLALMSECGDFELWGRVPAGALWLAFQLHDVGKIAVPWVFLAEKRRLTEEEREMVERHTEFGEAVLRFLREREHFGHLASPLGGLETRIGLRLAQEVALYHHENWDGSGYPRGLRERSIPFLARVARVADVVDALLFPRGYRGGGWRPEKVLIFLQRGRGKLFDPEVAQTAQRLLAPILAAACPECPSSACPLVSTRAQS
ncbi:HD-GYP domain-containing protein [Thermosulfurimonas sp. F29]|uniref:HD-GYP domain-containing protein n=1 Tax=Thermosulfurimonas sp. F29 TaxID=2867247 RepID=UPI001C83152B|nr:HD domain-containing phosphohydrolase [Thermosulfurimonas sp. F29]MBX6424230.1 HD domain-containing protein [Thermosulfurimonas sp. F29]